MMCYQSDVGWERMLKCQLFLTIFSSFRNQFMIAAVMNKVYN